MTTTTITAPAAHHVSNDTAQHELPEDHELYVLDCGHPAVDGITEVYDLPCGLDLVIVCGPCRVEHDRTCVAAH